MPEKQIEKPELKKAILNCLSYLKDIVSGDTYGMKNGNYLDGICLEDALGQIELAKCGIEKL